MSKTEEHGTYRYREHNCRCDICKKAAKEYNRKMYLLKIERIKAIAKRNREEK